MLGAMLSEFVNDVHCSVLSRLEWWWYF